MNKWGPITTGTLVLVLLGAGIAPAWAIALGDIHVQSNLTQRFKAKVRISGIGRSQLEKVNVRVAPPSDFRKLGVNRGSILNDFNFQKVHGQSNTSYIVIRTSQSVEQPVLSFLLQVDTPDGRLVRKYTVLLNPPGHAERRVVKKSHSITSAPAHLQPLSPERSAIGKAQVSSKSAGQSPGTLADSKPGSREKPPVADTPDAAKNKTGQGKDDATGSHFAAPEEAATGKTRRPNKTGEHTAGTLAGLLPLAQKSNAPDGRKTEGAQGASSRSSLPGGALGEARHYVHTQSLAAPSRAKPAKHQHATAEHEKVRRYGPVRRHQTLWSIAKAARPDSRSVTMDQVMMALYKANPEAFDGGINHLRAGTTLRIPSEHAMQAVDPRQAHKSTAQQISTYNALTAEQVRAVSGSLLSPPIQKSPGHHLAKTSGGTETPETGHGSMQIAAAGQGHSKGGFAANKKPLSKTARKEGENPASSKTANNNAMALQKTRDLGRIARGAGIGAAKSTKLSKVHDELKTPPARHKASGALGSSSHAGKKAGATSASRSGGESNGTTALKGQSDASQNLNSSPSDASISQKASSQPSAATNKGAGQAANLPQEGADDNTQQSGLLGDGRLLLFGVLLLLVLAIAVVAWRRLFSDKAVDVGRLETAYPGRAETEEAENVSSAKAELSPEADENPPAGNAETVKTEQSRDEDLKNPLMDADFHLSYGLYDDAIEILQEARKTAPERLDLQIKLLDAYYAASRPEPFVTLAHQVRGQTSTDKADWQRVAEMGAELAPSEPLFASTDTARTEAGESGTLEPELASSGEDHLEDEIFSPGGATLSKHTHNDAEDRQGAPAAEEGEIAPQPQGQGQNPVTDEQAPSGDDYSETEKEISTPGVDAETGSEGGDWRDELLEFELEPNADVPSESAGQEVAASGESPALETTTDKNDAQTDEPREIGEQVAFEEPAGFDLDQALGEHGGATTENNPETGKAYSQVEERSDGTTAGSEPQPESAYEDGDPESKGTGSADDMSTKLDLARAYLDMGDPDMAQNLLHTVSEKGTSEQRGEAEELRKRMD